MRIRATVAVLGAAAAALVPLAEAQPLADAYSLAPTTRCLRAHGWTVGPVRRLDRRRVALSDLAQRTSFEVSSAGRYLDVALAPSVSGAQLLIELLTVPGSSYRLGANRNAVLMYRPAHRAFLSPVVRCLRSG